MKNTKGLAHNKYLKLALLIVFGALSLHFFEKLVMLLYVFMPDYFSTLQENGFDWVSLSLLLSFILMVFAPTMLFTCSFLQVMTERKDKLFAKLIVASLILALLGLILFIISVSSVVQ